MHPGVDCWGPDNISKPCGVEIFPSGDRYEGGFFNGTWHGVGEFSNQDGTHYIGHHRHVNPKLNDLDHATYVLYGVKYIGLVSL